MLASVNGILLLDKSIGMTSHFALQRAKHLFLADKAGHTGSLDPLASGMLPICFGEATKFSQFLLDSDKSYFVRAQCGAVTTTGDSEGEIISVSPVEKLTESNINKMIANFIGEIKQIPPMYSAVKHQGKPLYKLARKGIEVERQPRVVKIYSIELKSIDQDSFCFAVTCSKGTYIRTLVEEMGKWLGCGAHVALLHRTMVQPYQQKKMYNLAELEKIINEQGREALYALLLPTQTAVAALPSVKLSVESAYYLRVGAPVRMPDVAPHSCVRLLGENDYFLGIGEILADGRIKARRLVANSI